ncbi:MAG: hypothetical protein O3A95_05270 [Planctomycetota bacterium]|nr:hypothetical protein [Planctomycetota bacterium]MDA1113695.1 hypothetical protein [Planctomycetota bacterium]
MSAFSTGRILRGIGWLALPFLTIVLILHFGAEPFDPEEMEAMPESLEVATPAPNFPVAVKLERANGEPAVNGVVLFFAPQLIASRMDEAGIAHASMSVEGDLKFLAFAPGHMLKEGLLPASARFGKTPVRLALLPEPVIEPGEKLVFLPRQITLVDGDDNPMHNVLLLVRDLDRPGDEPWIAFANAQGIAQIPDATTKALQVQAYAPGLPPRKASLLGAWDMPAKQVEIRFQVDAAYVQVDGLPPQGLLAWKRSDLLQLLPMIQISGDGEIALGPMPPGRYRLEVNQRTVDIDFQAGRQSLNFGAAAAAQN